jgi:hypothetical protein
VGQVDSLTETEQLPYFCTPTFTICAIYAQNTDKIISYYFISAVENWIVLGRWRFDRSRGLRLECKNPNLPDTELKLLQQSEKGIEGSALFRNINIDIYLFFSCAHSK